MGNEILSNLMEANVSPVTSQITSGKFEREMMSVGLSPRIYRTSFLVSSVGRDKTKERERKTLWRNGSRGHVVDIKSLLHREIICCPNQTQVEVGTLLIIVVGVPILESIMEKVSCKYFQQKSNENSTLQQIL